MGCGNTKAKKKAPVPSTLDQYYGNITPQLGFANQVVSVNYFSSSLFILMQFITEIGSCFR